MKTQLSSDEVIDFYNTYQKNIEINWKFNIHNIDNKKQIQLMNFIKLYIKKKN
jgi:hypothetical protein